MISSSSNSMWIHCCLEHVLVLTLFVM